LGRRSLLRRSARAPPAGRRRGARPSCCRTRARRHVGPGRVYVTLARYWASLGFTVVRVDLGSCRLTASTSIPPRRTIRTRAPAERSSVTFSNGFAVDGQRAPDRRWNVLGRVPLAASGGWEG
jgi:hypothetical protein